MYELPLEPQPVKTAHEQAIEAVVRAIDLTAIYHSHGNSTDAIESIAYVEPNSLVFLEGISSRSDGRRNYEDTLKDLNHYRLWGKTDPQYLELKQLLLEDIEAKLYMPARNATDFTQNNLTQLRLLLQKDCIMYYADYAHISDAGGNQELVDEGFSMFSRAMETFGSPALPDQIPGQGAEDAIKATQTKVINDLTMHVTREVNAVEIVLLTAAGLVGGRNLPSDINITGNQKLKTYVTYGAAHARTLTTKFNEYGIAHRAIEVSPLEDYQYLDLNPNNIGRRIGHSALADLTSDFFAPEDAKNIVAESYDLLNHLNVDRDESLKFLIRCVQVRQRQSVDEDDAFRQYLSILRSFMPNPQKFV
jgi:hypothetical protein